MQANPEDVARAHRIGALAKKIVDNAGDVKGIDELVSACALACGSAMHGSDPTGKAGGGVGACGVVACFVDTLGEALEIAEPRNVQ